MPNMKYSYGWECAYRGLRALASGRELRERLEIVITDALNPLRTDVFPSDLYPEYARIRAKLTEWQAIGEQSSYAASLSLMSDRAIKTSRPCPCASPTSSST